MIRAVVGWFRRLARFMREVLRDPRVPRWLKWGLVVLLAIPGPVDELAASVVLVILAVARWEIVRECWAASASKPWPIERIR